MRIALVRQRYAAGGGAEGYVARLLESLSAAGHEVHLFAHRWTGVPPGVTIHRVPVVPAPAFLRILSFAWATRRMTRRGGFDLVHSLDRTLSPDVYRAGDGCHRAWLDRRRAVEGNPLRLLDGVNPMHRSLLFLERRLFQGGCRCVIANSRMVQEEIRRYYETPGARIRVLYTGVDLARFRPAHSPGERAEARRALGIATEGPVVLFAGSGFERKGLRFLLEAMGRLRLVSGLRLWVLGKGNVGRARLQAERLGIVDRVHFPGVVTDPERWMAAADLFVLPTIYDPFSNACLEAMACGLPVATTRANGVAEIMEEWRTGAILADPRDVAGLVDRMAELLDPVRREERSVAARACAEGFPAEEHLKQMLATYEEVLKGARA
ncbi:MAG: glycosyltransferase family 4 protein [Candidatus Methylomirabilota bacterium]|jgi:UDP-glucose:(heptosyl)LPS alpha-1,3-glucosyltransferase